MSNLPFIALIVVATVAAYANSLRGPFILDDLTSIVDSTAIRHLWPLRDVFLGARPVVDFSWALNYAMGGLDTMPYHVTNLAIHLCAAVTLFGIVHRTLALPEMPGRLGRKALPLGLAAALIWALHPLQTQAVTYLTQRYESLMGLFYLAALYSLIRTGTSAHGRAWAWACVGAAALALGSKEVAVSLPISLLLYDRAFLAGSVREAWVRRRGLYLGLLGAWLGFALLQFLAPDRSGWSGYGLSHSWQEYTLSQFGVILHYLRLSLWPQPLVLDYGWPVAKGVREILPGAVVVGGMAAASLYALVQRPKAGFLGAWFFLTLVPSSSILPLADLAFLHRMYLPLAAVVLIAVLGGEAAASAMEGRGWLGSRGAAAAAMSALAAAAVALGAATWQRNRDYESALSIWLDTVAKAPGNARAHSNLGGAYAQLGDPEKAISHLLEAVRLKPDSAEALKNLGAGYVELKNLQMAVRYLQEAIRLEPDFPAAHNNLGVAYARLGDPGRAVEYLQEAIRLKPDYADALNNLGVAYGKLGEPEKAVGYLHEAIRLKPDSVDALSNLGLDYLRLGNPEKAAGYLREAVRLKPESPRGLYNYGFALVKLGRNGEATAIWRALQEIDPVLAGKLRAQIPG